MTREKRLDILSTLEDRLKIGKRYVVSMGGDTRLALTHPQDALYHLNASWLVHEKHDDDPGSRLCDCALHGQAHVHARQDYVTYAEACQGFADAEQAIMARRPLAWPIRWMPAWA